MNALGAIRLMNSALNSWLPGGGPDEKPGPTLDANLDSHDSSQWEKANWSNNGVFGNTWQPDNISFRDGIMVISLDKKGCPDSCDGKPYASGEYRTKQEYGYGTYEVRMKAASGDGLVGGTFFTYTGTWGQASHHEIDFEFLGKDPECKTLQLNYYAAGTGKSGEHEKIIHLPFNACESFHTYSFKWTPAELVYYVDGQVVHSANQDLPSQPGKIMANLWSGTGVDGWLGKFKYKGTIQAEYDWIRFTPLSSEELAPVLAPPAVTGIPASPPGDFERQTVEQFFNAVSKHIDDIVNPPGNPKYSQSNLIILVRTHKSYGTRRPDFSIALFESLISDWINSRNIGTTNGSELKLISQLIDLKFRTHFWRAILGLIALNDESIYPVIFPLIGLNLPSFDPHSDQSKLDTLEIIYANFIKPKEDLFQKLKAEYLTEKALLLWNMGRKKEAATAVKTALDFINILEKQSEGTAKAKLIKRNPGLTDKDDINGIIKNERAKLLVFRAKLLMLQAEHAAKPQEAEAKLVAAYESAKLASAGRKDKAPEGLEGLELLETELLGAQALIRLANIKKDLGEEYQNDLNLARSSLEYIIDWGNQYNAKIADEKRRHPWMKILSDQSRLWLGKIVSEGYSDIKKRLTEKR